MSFVFEEPPAQRGGAGESPRNKEIAEALRARPNEWALVGENEKNDGLAARIRSGKAKSFAEGKWQAKTRRNEDNTVNIWARYVTEVEGE